MVGDHLLLLKDVGAYVKCMNAVEGFWVSWANIYDYLCLLLHLPFLTGNLLLNTK